jgi:hypothetical protein
MSTENSTPISLVQPTLGLRSLAAANMAQRVLVEKLIVDAVRMEQSQSALDQLLRTLGIGNNVDITV